MSSGGILDLFNAEDERDMFSPEPVEGDEGYDPHEEHREYERLKEQYRRAEAEIKALRGKNNDAKPKAEQEKAKTDWKRAFVLAEVIGKPRCKR